MGCERTGRACTGPHMLFSPFPSLKHVHTRLLPLPVKTTEEAQAVHGRDLVIAACCGLLGLKKRIRTSVCRGRGAGGPHFREMLKPLPRVGALSVVRPGSQKAGGRQHLAPPQGAGACAQAGRAGQGHLEGGLCPSPPGSPRRPPLAGLLLSIKGRALRVSQPPSYNRQRRGCQSGRLG